MSVKRSGGSVVVDDSIPGSLFPTNEADILYPVLVDGTKSATGVLIEGALYGRSVELRGNVSVRGPFVARGDVKLNPGEGRVSLGSGITINGSLNTPGEDEGGRLRHSIEKASVVVKGDIAVNQNVFLRNSIVFGSIRAVNCKLENSIVMGTCIVEESLTISRSSIGGYASRTVNFEGDCMMLHALGESTSQPVFSPYEGESGEILSSDVRYYPAVRGAMSLLNKRGGNPEKYPDYSRLYPESDWVPVMATANTALEEERDEPVAKWVLSIGGRIGDATKIFHAIDCLASMLRCGFEYEHYHSSIKSQRLSETLQMLTDEEKWILTAVCS